METNNLQKTVAVRGTKRQIEKKADLELALIPYMDYWEEWIADPACFLNDREILVLMSFKDHLHWAEIFRYGYSGYKRI